MRSEKFLKILLYILPFGPILGVVLYFQRGEISSVDQNILTFLANSIFFNTVHGALSFFLISDNQHVSTLFKSKFKNPSYRKFFFSAILSIAIITMLVTWPWPNKGYAVLASYVIASISMHHGWAQYNGIWNIINHSNGWESPNRSIDSVFKYLFLFLGIAGIGLKKFKVINVYTDVQKNMLAYSILLVVIYLIYCVSLFIFRKKGALVQSIFTLRYLALAMIPIAPIAGAGVAMVHGLEYLILYSLMMGKSSFAPFRKAFPVLIFVLFFIFSFFSKDGAILRLIGFPIPHDYFPWIFMLVNFLTIIHYFLDREIFKMRDPETRFKTGLAIEQIGKL
jgi:hypothetical protein